MKPLHSKYKILLSSFFLLMIVNVFPQSEKLATHIQNKLTSIDKLLIEKRYELVLTKLEELENYKEFISKDDNRLLVDLKKAMAHYGRNDREMAMSLLLNGLDELKVLKSTALQLAYLKYLGEIFYKSKDYNRSLDYFKMIYKIAQNGNDTLNILDSYFYFGRLYSRKNIKDSAFYYYSKIIEYPLTPEAANIISNTYSNLSGLSGEIGDLEQSLEFANKSLEIEKQEQDSIGIANALINLSGVYYDNQNFNKAKLNYEDAYEYVKNNNTLEGKFAKELALYNLAYSNEMLGDFKNAYTYLEQATYLTDSLITAQSENQISEINAKYNLEKVAKEAEEAKSKQQSAQFVFYATIFAFITFLVFAYIFYRNYRLKQEKAVDKLVTESQIKIINATIDAKEKERKSIAEILHDSVSALLSSANLHLQATKAQLKTGYPQEITKAQTIVNEASVKIRDLSHELISSVLLKFGLAFAVHDMCQKYSNSEISLFSDDDGVKRYEQDFEIKIHSIIEELVNNILKHSKATNATIMLAHRENNMLSIRMNDDGVGFDAKTAKTKGGLGLSHIEARIKVMKGVFNIVSSKDNGTSIFIMVPIVEKVA